MKYFILTISTFSFTFLNPKQEQFKSLHLLTETHYTGILPGNKSQEAEVKTGTFTLTNKRILKFKIDREYAGSNHYACTIEVTIARNRQITYQKIIFDEMVDAWPQLSLKDNKLVVKLKYYEHQSDKFTIDKRYWLIKNNRLQEL